ncbi:MAG: hypothetical protein GC136_05920 [Alphaproteobacteria bacterium]|nr:hypothetical protein [Alphaproteobacteria bacterium]
MRKLSLLLLTLAFFMPHMAQAADVKIGVLDTAIIMSKSKAAQSLQSQLKTTRDAFDKEVADFDKKMQDKEKALKDQQGKADAAEFDKQRKQAESDFIKGRAALQQKKLNIEKSITAATSQIQEKLVSIVGDIAKKEKLNIVLTRQQVVTMDESMNITDKVLGQLDSSLPTVSLK